MNSYLVISDIHGDRDGIDLIQQAINQHAPYRILCLGDILYHGPRNDLPEHYDPKQVIPFMNALTPKIIAVRGNCDAEVDQMVLNFPITADYSILPMCSRNAFLTHGHIYSPSKLLPLNEGDLFVSGHTHIPSAEVIQGIYFLNPGSVSLPKQNYPRSYGILNDDEFRVYNKHHQVFLSIRF